MKERPSISQLAEMLSRDCPSQEFLSGLEDDRRKGVKRLLEKYYRNQQKAEIRREKAERMLTQERRLWSLGYTYIAGIDEVGRGPLAGPVTAACVVFPRGLSIVGVDDSKRLTEKKREELYSIIMDKALYVGVASVDNLRIDSINILKATLEAMKTALSSIDRPPDYLLIDALKFEEVDIPQLPLVSGDQLSQSIAAASIIAKVTRDREMVRMAEIYPGYGFEKNKGYGTRQHLKAISKMGLCPIHRRTFTSGMV